jgi:C-terminal processing protease CtpA/Prc
MLAIEEWLTPAGHLIWHQGISPDVVVTLPPEGTPLLPATERGMTAEKLRESRDLQLLRGLELLTESGPTQPRQLNRLNEKYKICCDYGVNRDEPKSKSLLGYPQ